jgi:tRNA A37 threonylcarbamoyltransferase TsaD
MVCDIAYDFQEAVVEVMAKKLLHAWEVYWAKTLGLAWWVSANNRLCEYIQQLLEKKHIKTPFLTPIKKVYSTDNWAMIGVVWLLSKRN